MKFNITHHVQQILIMIIMIIIGATGRYVLFGLGLQPFPNFEIIMVISFVAVMLTKSTYALVVPLSCMIISDILIGNPIFIGHQMNRIVIFTYSGFTIIALLNIILRERIRPCISQIRLKNVVFTAGLGSIFVLIYDIWTNFGWWYLMYSHSIETFATVYLAGIPFMIYHLISGITTFILIGLPIYVVITKYIPYRQIPPINLKHKIPLITATILLIALAFTGTGAQIPENSEIWLEQSDTTSVSITIRGDTWSLKDNLFAYPEETVFSILERTLTKSGMVFEYTYYPDFESNLIELIHINKNGDEGKYWQYYVNGELPMVGADQYSINNGDQVLWQFESVPG